MSDILAGLQMAVAEGTEAEVLETVRYLDQCGYDWRTPDVISPFAHPLATAIDANRLEMVQLLLGIGVKPDTMFGSVSALEFAVAKGKTDISEYLRNHERNE